MRCKFCEYDWETRKKEPKACPRCKRRFDYPSYEIVIYNKAKIRNIKHG